MFISNFYVSDHILNQNAPNKLDSLSSSRLEKSFTPLVMNFCSKAVEIRCSASFNSWIVLGIT